MRRTPARLTARVTARLTAVVAALALAASAVPAGAQDGPVVGTAPPEDALLGWIEGWTDPDFWTSYLHDALLKQHVNVPYPIDPVKPEAYLPNVPIKDGRYTSRLPVRPRDLSRITYTYGGQTKTIRQFVRTTRTDQVVLVHRGRVVGEFYANGFTARTRHQAWSVTKTFVAAVVGIARKEGRIRSLRDPIERYIPSLRGTQWQGRSFEKILERKLWRRMGAADDAVMTADRVGSVIASHGLFARPRDFARFGEVMRLGGRTADGRRVLPRGWVRAMTRMTKVSGGKYGLQTWAHPIAAPDAYSASGFQGQKITVLPSDCLTAVRMSHALGADLSEGFSIGFYAEEWQTMLRAVADALGGCPNRR